MTVTLAPHGGPRPGGNARQRRRLRRWLARVSVVCENATLRIENLTGEKVTVIVTGRGR